MFSPRLRQWYRNIEETYIYIREVRKVPHINKPFNTLHSNDFLLGKRISATKGRRDGQTDGHVCFCVESNVRPHIQVLRDQFKGSDAQPMITSLVS